MIPVTLREWQEPHAARLAEILERNGSAADLSDTGTGKTYSACGAARALGRRLFVTSPRNSAEGWMKVAVKMNAGFFFSGGWEEARSKSFRWNRFGRDENGDFNSLIWTIPNDCLLVFDEAHRAKGNDTMNSMLLSGAREAWKRGIPTLMLSASLASKAAEMKAAGYVLGLHNNDDFEDFKGLHKGEEGMALLNKRLFDPESGVAARMRTSEIPGFPKNNIFPELVAVEGSAELSKWRQDAERRASQLEGEAAKRQSLVARLRYRQAAEMRKLPAIMERIKDAVAEGNSVAVFLCFRETLFHALKLIGVKAVALYGDQDRKQAAAAVELFQSNKVPVIFCMHGVGSESVGLHDLHGRPRISLISPPESPFQLKQCLGRLPRDGALSPAMQYILYALGVEEDVYASTSAKVNNIETLNDGVRP